MGRYLITAEQLWSSMGGGERPCLIDVRRDAVFADDGHMIPGALRRPMAELDAIVERQTGAGGVVFYCAHGHQLSQIASADARARGIDARTLKGGIDGWRAAGLPMLSRSGLPEVDLTRPSRWVTRRRPKIDRIACPWLIRTFIDPTASFLFVEPDQVLAAAAEIGGVAYDIEGAPITHQGELCSFDVLLERSDIDDPALRELALIVRGADTARLDLAPEAAGLLAVSIGISAIAGEDDHRALELGFAVYDALYAWRRKSPEETHNWPSGQRA